MHLRCRRFGFQIVFLTALAACAPAAEPAARHAAREGSRLDTLFLRLRKAQDPAEAALIEQQIWTAWTASGRPDVDRLMTHGLEAMASGDYGAAARAFDRVVTLAPNFPEGWNKRATIHYLRGDYPASLRDIGRTLALEKRHFGALSGLGTIYITQGNHRGALHAFQAVLELHPQARGTRRLVNTLRAKLGIVET